MSRTSETTIADRRYSTTKFPVEQFLELELKLQKVLGKSVAQAVAAVDFNEGTIKGESLGDAIDSFTDNLVATGGVSLYKQILASTTVILTNDRGEDIQFQCKDLNAAFDGRPADLKRVIYWVLKENFASYFSDASGPLSDIVQQFKARAAANLTNAFATAQTE